MNYQNNCKNLLGLNKRALDILNLDKEQSNIGYYQVTYKEYPDGTIEEIERTPVVVSNVICEEIDPIFSNDAYLGHTHKYIYKNGNEYIEFIQVETTKNIYLALRDGKTNHMIKESMWTPIDISILENN